MNAKTNSKIMTPIGDGVVQGNFSIRDEQGELIVNGVLVRLPITDATRGHLTQANCLTPRAVQSALWVFAESDVR